MTWWIIEGFDRDEALSASRERENYHTFSQLQRKKKRLKSIMAPRHTAAFASPIGTSCVLRRK
jgi:hypothetical protein